MSYIERYTGKKMKVKRALRYLDEKLKNLNGIKHLVSINQMKSVDIENLKAIMTPKENSDFDRAVEKEER